MAERTTIFVDRKSMLTKQCADRTIVITSDIGLTDPRAVSTTAPRFAIILWIIDTHFTHGAKFT